MTVFDELFSLEDRTALVVGGNRGIGGLFARTFASAGANVAVAARTLETCQHVATTLSEEYGVRTMAQAMDVRESGSVTAAVGDVIGELGPIDILVNSAGISGDTVPTLDMPEDNIDAVMSVNLRGAFLTSKAVGARMKERKSGRIINISSVSGKVAARNMSAYCASKAALNQLTKVMALEFARHNVQVNALCLGYFLTDLNRDFFATVQGQEMIRKMIPVGRVGDLDELRSTALYLATCPAFLTGAELYVDGGHTVP